MKHGKFKRVLALVLAILLLVSSTGYSIDLHFCQGQFQTFNLYGKAKKCHDNKKVSPCHASTKPVCQPSEDLLSAAGENSGCCRNQQVEIEASVRDVISTELISLPDIDFSPITVLISADQDPSESFNYRVSYPVYKPPNPERDIQILYQTLLI